MRAVEPLDARSPVAFEGAEIARELVTAWFHALDPEAPDRELRDFLLTEAVERVLDADDPEQLLAVLAALGRFTAVTLRSWAAEVGQPPVGYLEGLLKSSRRGPAAF